MNHHVRFRDNYSMTSLESNSKRKMFPMKKRSFRSSMAKTRRGMSSCIYSDSCRRFPSSHWNSQVSTTDNDYLESSSFSNMEILDPQGSLLEKLNKMFIISCLLAIIFDPLFFYIPVIDTKNFNIASDQNLEIIACVLRSVNDLFYVFHIVLQFRTGFICPSSRVFGRGELVVDPQAIARKYITSYLTIDTLSVLPLPQAVFCLVMPDKSIHIVIKTIFKYAMYAQYIPRLWRMYPLYKEVMRTSGKIVDSAWFTACIHLCLYMLASHTIGALWHLISAERMDHCWGKFGRSPDNHICSLDVKPNKTNDQFDFGIFLEALQTGVVERKRFTAKLLYCFWWGLRHMSSLGQNLITSDFEGEILFAFFICVVGLVLFAYFIGNMQKYLQSITVRIDEMRVKRHDTEQWMSHRMLPDNLRERIRRHNQYKWQETRGVEEEEMIRSLPKDLRRDVKRHLFWTLLKRVPMFGKMDEQLMDAMCSFLKPVLYTEDSIIVREGDPVEEMLFIMRGDMLTMTTNGGRTGVLNSVYLKAGDFCGEELLTWALDPNSLSRYPISTRTVQAKKDVEAFALVAHDLKFVASQFRRLHSKQLRHTFRFYSEQWRTWGACFIQVAWRRYHRKKVERSLQEVEGQGAFTPEGGSSPSLGSVLYATRFAANMLGSLRRNYPICTRTSPLLAPLMLQKPKEPDFSQESSVEHFE